ncbi:MAG TPA: nuclear transport factor 2 family protein [Actinomycetota bacterium]|nr:nuclear transport factor 2 family protein [Actinomycetota bacterium]
MSDVAIVERVYRALADKDVASLFELYSPDCVITQDERLPWGGRHVGHDGLVAFGVALSGAIDSAVTIGAT